jgi:prolyl 4-hydroxylase
MDPRALCGHFLTQEECAAIVDAFDAVEDKRQEGNNDAYVYSNSYGVYNLPITLPYADRLTKKLQAIYPNVKFANAYTREYLRHGKLGIHLDRKGLDLTLSVCLEDNHNLFWPLNISKLEHKGPWKSNEDNEHYKQEAISVVLPVGHGAFVEGGKHPHWRDELLCGEAQRAVYTFFHWTLEEVKPKRIFPTLLTSDSPKLSLHDGFMTKDECAQLIALAEPKLRQSTIINSNTGMDVVDTQRTSWGMFFKRGETPLIVEIEKRLEELTGISVEHGEGLQILRYEVGQEYRPHNDYFDKDKPGFDRHIGEAGHRVCTVLLYLNTPEEGGGTVFPDVGMTVPAREGNALWFQYPTPDATSKTFHGGEPVRKGVKWVATKWYREKPYNK